MNASDVNVEFLLKDTFARKVLIKTFDEGNQLRHGYHDYCNIITDGQKINRMTDNFEISNYIYSVAHGINDKEISHVFSKEVDTKTSEEAVSLLLSLIKKSKNTKSKFISEILQYLSREKIINYYYEVEDTIVYRSDINLVEITSVSSLLSMPYLRGIYDGQYYRGHGSLNYSLLPNVMRSFEMIQEETKMFKQMLLLCPDEFPKTSTTLEKMVKMQHYSLPTRLLDITSNPLVALYFACSGDEDKIGEFVLFKKDKIEYTDKYDLKLSALSNFAIIGIDYQIVEDEEDAENTISVLKRHIIKELPEYSKDIDEINIAELLQTSAYYSPPMNNQRISKQSGAFILCSENSKDGELYNYRDYWDKKSKCVFYIRPQLKNKILEELEKLNINEASMFPEIEHIAKYVKNMNYGKSVYKMEKATKKLSKNLLELFRKKIETEK